MNLYETEALTSDPESRRGWIYSCWCIFFVFFPFVFFVLSPSGSINVHGAFFYGESPSYGKRKTSKEKNIRLLCFIHFMLEPVEALLHQEGTSHERFNRDQDKLGGRGGMEKRQLLAIISCQAAFQEMVNLWDHDASLAWTRFIACWRTIQPILYKTFVCSFLTRVICTSRLRLQRPYTCVCYLWRLLLGVTRALP